METPAPPTPAAPAAAPSPATSPATPPPPPPPRAGGDPFAAFDGKVADAPAARRKPGQKKAAGKKPAEEPAPPPKPAPTPEQLEDARLAAEALVDFVDGALRAGAAKRYAVDGASEETLASLDKQLAFNDRERAMLVRPLAKGLVGVEVPWWVQLSLAGVFVLGPRVATLGAMEKAAGQARKDREKNLTPQGPVPSAKAA